MNAKIARHVAPCIHYGCEPKRRRDEQAQAYCQPDHIAIVQSINCLNMVMTPKDKIFPREDWYWPLGSLGYVDEIRDQYPSEAELLGVITILWNRQELALKRLFMGIVSSRNEDFVSAIWDRQPTHQSRRDMLALAISTAKLTKRQVAILTHIVDRTKTIADRRNELIHAEYVVHGNNYHLHAKVKSPRSTKPPKFQKVAESDLKVFAGEMQLLLQLTEGAWLDFMTPREKRFAKSVALSSKEILASIRDKKAEPK